MKHCPYCKTDYAMSETECPSCNAVVANIKCDNCTTIHNGAFCPNCGFGIHEVLRDCPKCGYKTKERVCPRCGHDIAAMDSFKTIAKSVVSQVSCEVVGHAWNGTCKCTRCGETRDINHTYFLIDGKCEQKCSVCGKIKSIPHQWNGDRCSRCGSVKGPADKFWESLGARLPFFHLEKKLNRLFFGIGLLVIILVIIGNIVVAKEANAHEGEIRMPSSASSYVKENYQDVTSKFKNLGFTNIKTEVLDDLVTGWITKDGSVEQVSINGDTSFSSGSYFPKDAEIIITYHTFPERQEPVEQVAEEPQEEAVEQEQQEVESIDLKSVLDSFLGEPYTVAYEELTEAGYDITWLHAVTGDDFTSSVIYQIENPDPVDDVPWLVVDYASLDYHDSELLYNVTEFELLLSRDKALVLFIDTEENMDRIAAAENLEQSLQAKLDINCAWGSVTVYGQKQYPAGFKLLIGKGGLLAETPEDEDTWFLKAYCDVTNAYGTTMKNMTCEALVTGTSENPKVTYFIVY